MKRSKTLLLARAGVIAALYVALTYAFMSMAYGPIQIRVGEALTMLPLLYVESIPALFIGCILANIGSPFGFYDILVGSIVSLIAAIITYFIGKFIKNKILKVILGGLPPILLNAFILPCMWYYFWGDVGFWANVASMLMTQSIFVYALGIPLYFALDRLKNKGIKAFL